MNRCRRWTLLALLALLVTPLAGYAQQTPGNGMVYGGAISGQINNRTPRIAYTFEGLRGEVVSISLTVTEGNLDPILTVFGAGQLLARADDSGGRRDIRFEALRLPASSTYTLVVGRFGYGLGSTSGSYTLTVERIGVSSASGSALRYGDTVINAITNLEPQVFYSFRAQRGDIINVHMLRVSGDLDPYLQIVDSSAFLLADNDDTGVDGSLDAHINGLLIENDGTYIIKATRYGEAAGTSTGRFVLVLEEADNSGLGNSPQAALPLAYGDVVEGALDDAAFERYYFFDARANDLITVRMSRVGGALDSFLIISNAGLQQLTADDDSGGGQNAKIENYLIPADGRYYITAARFEGAQGKTAGRYRLELQSAGNAFDGVPDGVQRLTYGITTTGRIDDATPEVLFAFYGSAGDAITIGLNRGDGDLDPSLALLDASGSVLVSDDDGGGGQNALIGRYELPRSGLYFIRAGRFSGTDGRPNTQGSFILVLARVFG